MEAKGREGTGTGLTRHRARSRRHAWEITEFPEVWSFAAQFGVWTNGIGIARGTCCNSGTLSSTIDQLNQNLQVVPAHIKA